jgi:hypothetical protein
MAQDRSGDVAVNRVFGLSVNQLINGGYEMTVKGSACGCCGEVKFVENVAAYEARQASGEAIFCDACMELPEDDAVRMILARDAARAREGATTHAATSGAVKA